MQHQMGTSSALMVSYLLSSPAYSFYCFLLLCNRIETPLYISLPLSILSLSILPILYIITEYRRGRTDIFVTDKDKRPKFFIPALISYAMGALAFTLLGDGVLAAFHLCYLTVTATIFLVSLKWKISIHTAGIAGPTTFLVYYLGPVYTILYLLIPLAAWSRYKLRAHTIPQLVMGALVALIVTHITCSILEPIIHL